ncbi:MAG: MFS transporter [Bacteroidales bacterium]
MIKALKILRDSKYARWIVLLCLALPMFASYFFDDIYSPISQIFQNPELLDIGWNSEDFGWYHGAYSMLCVWGGLIICGILLDKWGVRITGSVFVGLMSLGSVIIMYGISKSFFESDLYITLSKSFDKPSVLVSAIGCSMFGLGSEIAGVTVNRSIAKWFKGKEMALAMGIQLAIARFGSAVAIFIVPYIMQTEGHISFSETSRPVVIGVILLFAALLIWAIFIAMDYQRDKHNEKLAVMNKVVQTEKDKFKFKDIFNVLSNSHFIIISLLCVFFYVCIISFKKFATAIIIPRFGIDIMIASQMVAMIPFCTLIFAPLFGYLVDRLGKGTKIMIVGSFLVLLSHLIIAFAPSVQFFGYLGIALLGVGYSLVPAALWPSVPKIIPEKNLGTAFSLLYWIQNMGMLLVPIFVGRIFDNAKLISTDMTESALQGAVRSEYLFIALSIVAIILSIIFSISSDRHPELLLDKKVVRQKN